jgi:hypothetical protein
MTQAVSGETVDDEVQTDQEQQLETEATGREAGAKAARTAPGR